MPELWRGRQGPELVGTSRRSGSIPSAEGNHWKSSSTESGSDLLVFKNHSSSRKVSCPEGTSLSGHGAGGRAANPVPPPGLTSGDRHLGLRADFLVQPPTGHLQRSNPGPVQGVFQLLHLARGQGPAHQWECLLPGAGFSRAPPMSGHRINSVGGAPQQEIQKYCRQLRQAPFHETLVSAACACTCVLVCSEMARGLPPEKLESPLLTTNE